MKTITSDTPASDAGAYMQDKILSHAHEHILCMISGGSALTVLEAIDATRLRSNVTIVFVDERFTDDRKGNNFTQLTQTNFYKSAREVGVQFIDSTVQTNETLECFTQRLNHAFNDYYKIHSSTYTIGLFGIGEDGHTAGIFPMSESDFIGTFETEDLYVSITNKALTYPYRTTVTPTCIEEKIDEVILFAVGSSKCDNILNYMHNKNFTHYQIPALIPAQHPQSILFTDCHTLL